VVKNRLHLVEFRGQRQPSLFPPVTQRLSCRPLMARDMSVSWSSVPNQQSNKMKPVLHHVSPQKIIRHPSTTTPTRNAPPPSDKPAAAAPPPAARPPPAPEKFFGQAEEEVRKAVRVEKPPAPVWEPPPKKERKPPPKPLFEPRKSGRPSLSDQLAALGSKTEAVTKGIKQSLVKGEDLGKETALVLCQCDRFVVGRVVGAFTSPVQFFTDRALYAFIHPTQERIDMKMIYRHMSDIEVDDSKLTFRFRLRRPMGTTFWQWFKDDYEPHNASHFLQVGFESKKDFVSFKSKALPLIRASAVG